jgi:hypothetical protein
MLKIGNLFKNVIEYVEWHSAENHVETRKLICVGCKVRLGAGYLAVLTLGYIIRSGIDLRSSRRLYASTGK